MIQEITHIENGNSRSVANIYPNPFSFSFSVESPVEDVLLLQSIEGKNIGYYPIQE